MSPTLTTPIPLFALGGIVNTPATQVSRGGTIIPMCTNVGINAISIDENAINIYPNPSNDEFTIHNTQFTISNIQITDVLGKKVYNDENPSCESCIVHCALSRGIYFVHVTGNRQTLTEKIIVGQ